MKKVICAQDIEALAKQGQTSLCTREGIILTPSAKDAAKAKCVTVCPGRPDCVENPCSAPACEDEISSELIYSALQVVQSQGLLDEFCSELSKQLCCFESDSPVKN